MQPSRDKPPEHGTAGLIAMEGKAGDVGLAASAGHDPVHRLDDIAANPDIP
jgi:hypothetical protein